VTTAALGEGLQHEALARETGKMA